jgi:hypothetical protein
MKRYLPAVLALAMLVLSGALHGMWTNRWVVSTDLQTAVERLADVPTAIDDWDGKDVEVDSRQLARAEIVGYRAIQYVQRHTGKRVMVLLLCGRPGPIAVHTPDICYQGIGYRMAGALDKQPVKYGPDKQEVEFWTARFLKPESTVAPKLRIHWAWNAAGEWRAADNPRLSFGGFGALYKMYVVHSSPASGVAPTPDAPPEDDTSLAFMNVLIPELQKALYPHSP